MPQELSDHSSDTVMDVTDLADLDVYSELTTEGISRLKAQYGGGHSNATERHCDFKLAVTRKSRPCRGTLRVLIKLIAA